MNPALAGVAVAVLVGALVAVTARDARVAIVALGFTLVLSPLLADPPPEAVGLAARLAGAILGAFLLWVAVRRGGLTGGSHLGWPAETMLGAAAFVVGLGTHGLGATPLGPVEAQAAGFALAALAIVPVATGRDVVRIGIALFLLLESALLVRVGLGGNPAAFEQLVTAALVVALGGSVAALAWAARSDGPGGYALATEGRARLRRPQDVRRTGPRPSDGPDQPTPAAQGRS